MHVDQRIQHRVLVGEMPVEGGGADARAGRDRGGAQPVHAEFVEQFPGCVEDRADGVCGVRVEDGRGSGARSGACFAGRESGTAADRRGGREPIRRC
jgi:hypothetical protein